MSTRPQHRTRSAAVLAAADQPALNVDPCATVLLQAAIWPGTTSDGTRLVSDGFVTHLSQQAPCDSALSRR